MTDQNQNYYLRRAEEEQAAAERATNPAISQIHRDLARRYRNKLKGRSPQIDLSEVAKSLHGMTAA